MYNEIHNKIIDFFSSGKSNKAGGLTKTFTNEQKEYIKTKLKCSVNQSINDIKNGYCNICIICGKRRRKDNNYCSRKCYFSDPLTSEKFSKGHKEYFKENPRKKHVYKYIIAKCIECNKDYNIHIKVNGTYRLTCYKCSIKEKNCLICNTKFKSQGKTCSLKCANKLREKSYLKNYGVKHNFHIKEHRSNTIEYWLARGLNIEDAKIALSNRQRITPEKFINRYGLEEGEKRWAKFCSYQYSEISQKLFRDIYKLIKDKDKKYVYFGNLNKEFYLERYLLDFTITGNFNKCIEFNGEYWHASPSKYKENDILYRNLTAKEIWNNDIKKIKCINDHGFKTLVIWEDDYRNNQKNIITKCMEFIYENKEN